MAQEYSTSAMNRRAGGNTQANATRQSSMGDALAMQPSGWTVFSGVMLALAGSFGMFNGLIALIHDEVYVVGEDRIVALDFTQWGWVHLIGGAVVLAAGLAVTSGALWARILGVLVAFLHALSQIAFIEAYPFWSVTIIAMDVMVIFGCLVHGREVRYE